MSKWIKKWWFSILCWVVMCLIYTLVFWFLHADDDLIIIGGCICAYIILGMMFMLIGIMNAPQKEENKYKYFKDFLEWYEKNKKEK